MTTEKRPKTAMWKREPTPNVSPRVREGIEVVSSWWRLGSLRVLSGMDGMKSAVDKSTVPHWHVSVSRIGGHPSDADVAVVRKAFGMNDAEEDNHEPGRARHLFLAIDPAHRAPCECNTAEMTIVEANGHVWKSPPAEVQQRRRLMQDLPHLI